MVGGAFSSYNGVTNDYIVRLNSNGTIDNTFITGSTNGFNDYDNIVLRVNDLVMFIDREITESEYERPFNVFLYKGNIVYDLVSWEPTFIKTFNEIKQQQ